MYWLCIGCNAKTPTLDSLRHPPPTQLTSQKIGVQVAFDSDGHNLVSTQGF
jgi:hypothetical protein